MRPRQEVALARGRYIVREQDKLGDGYFGEVYRGRDTHQDAAVAIKLFRADVEFDQVMLEAQLQTRLSGHARVVSIRNVVLEPPRPFVVMDYFAAGSVNDRLEGGSVTLVEAIRWTRDALAGLGHAHVLGVVHRDVKPSNWLLGANDRAAISDFGVAEDTIRRVRVDDRIYWRHMAPEVTRAGSSARSDVWSTGCTLYRLLTGDFPFEDLQAAALGEFVRPHRINRQVPMSLTRVVERALEVDPAERYSNAGEMLSALNGCHVACSWRPIDRDGALEAWSAEAPDAAYIVELVRRPRAGLELRALRDLRRGAGFRTVRREPAGTVERGLQRLRRWLLDVVEGRPL
jgi:eukaryotic-like serine/threonine-protein kinase